MKKNMSRMDGIVRLILALTIGFLYYFDVINGLTASILGAVALIFIITGFINFCPLYAVLKIRTLPKSK